MPRRVGEEALRRRCLSPPVPYDHTENLQKTKQTNNQKTGEQEVGELRSLLLRPGAAAAGGGSPRLPARHPVAGARAAERGFAAGWARRGPAGGDGAA